MLRPAVAVCALALAGVAGLLAAPRDAPRADFGHVGSAPAEYGGPSGRRALTGPWSVRATRGPARRVSVPYAYNGGDLSMRSFEGSVATYRTTFSLAAAGDYAIAFGSVQHEATVWLDGRLLARHTGAYLPFEVRARLGAGSHRLAVRADWRDPLAMRAQGWHRTWFNFGGLGREVTIRRLGASELDSPGLVTRLARGAAVATVTVRVRNRAGPRAIAVRGSLAGVPLRFAPVRLGAGRAAWVRARVRLARVRLWAPGHPALYELALAVPGESGYRAPAA